MTLASRPELFDHEWQRVFPPRLASLVGQYSSNEQHVLLAIEVELLEILYEGSNPFALGRDGVTSIQIDARRVRLPLSNLQVVKKIEYRHSEKLRKLRQLVGRYQSLSGFEFLIGLQGNTDMSSSSPCI